LKLVESAARQHPVLGDYALYFRARAAAHAGHDGEVVEAVRQLLSEHEDSVWAGRARLLAGEVLQRKGDTAAARGWLTAARVALPEASPFWARATLRLARLEGESGDPAAALELARGLRSGKTRGLAAWRARRLAERVRGAHPELATVDHVGEAEFRLREGDATGAHSEAETALASDITADERARALWTRAQAERALGDRPAAEATCLRLASEDDPLAARALLTAGGWRWNADDDTGALRFFHQTAARFPNSPQAAEALYAIGRIEQEAGRYEHAFEAYRQVNERYPGAPLATESGWRAGWVRYLASQFEPAARWFARLAARTPEAARPAAEYWGARALERLGRRTESVEKLTHLAEFHTTSYYAGLAEERLGRSPAATQPSGSAESDSAPPFPTTLTGTHAERARALADLGLKRFARRELDALATDAPRRDLIDAYRSVGAVGAALRVARDVWRDSTNTPRRDLYPLGYWDVVRPAALGRSLDPFLVVSLIRQESLFDPEALSGAGARGLMQLMPATARELSRRNGSPGVDKAALFDPAVNVDLGTALLSRLLERYGGSPTKALAAYNAGQDAVAKWERRYSDRENDEFVELISYRETRDYVKAVLRNYRLYRRLYAPSDSATSAGSPPNAPFDMTTITSPGRADATR
jgi:peptidoglycan lytic transglycosylase